MSKIGVSVKIDVTKIDKALLYKNEKGAYLNATVFIDVDTPDKYGNHGMVTQDVSKEAKDAGEKGPILGNVKVFWRDSNPATWTPIIRNPTGNPTGKPARSTKGDDFDDDIPF
jgi:hypothetical protein